MIPDYSIIPKPPRRSRMTIVAYVVICVFAIAIIVAGSRLAGNISNATISIVNRIARTSPAADGEQASPQRPKIANDPEYQMPENDNNRLDVLILGIRGRDDVENGGLLTDTILLMSLDPSTGIAALTSIPRDLIVRVTDAKTEKINTIYANNGLAGTRRLYSRIIGVAIDNVAVFDFDAFKSVVDMLGGVTIALDKPFDEVDQWGYPFSLPAGLNTLNGDQALYYVRSRYMTSDFDRSRRQMQIIVAIRQKIDSLQVTGDPLKALQIANAIRMHLDTDLNIFDIGAIRDIIREETALSKIRRRQLTSENLLYETTVSGSYELLPRWDTLSLIKEFFRTILTP